MFTFPVAHFAGGPLYEIDFSMRFDEDGYLNDNWGTPSSSAQFGYAFWMKPRSNLDGTYIISSNGSGNNDNFYFNSGGKINIQEGGVTRLVSNDGFNDTSIWYHFVVAYDLGNGTADHKLRVYADGSEITSWSTNTRSSFSSTSSRHNASGVGFDIGANVFNGVSNHVNKLDAVLADFFFIDGSVITPSDFGSVSGSNFIPSEYDGSFGGNSFYLDFAIAPGTGNGAGNDVSGEGNHLTEASLSADDRLTDTPTS